MMKFGTRGGPGTPSPYTPNFVKKIAQGDSSFGAIFSPKFEIFTLYSYLNVHYYAYNVQTLLKGGNATTNPGSTT